MTCVRRAVLRTRSLPKERVCGGSREYDPGNEARVIDWPASARRGSIQIRERDRHATLAWAAVVDTSPSMKAGRDRSLGEAAREAGEFWRECAAPGDRWLGVDPGGLLGGLDRALHRLPGHSALLVISDFFDLPEVPDALLRAVARRLDSTALVARDPWRKAFPLAGFVTIADLETGAVRKFFIGASERLRFERLAGERERSVLTRLTKAGWRAATFDENDGGRAVLRAFRAA